MSEDYAQRKRLLRRLLTVYGRKPVLEALRDPQLACHRLHLASSNRDDNALKEMRVTAAQRGIDIVEHTRAELARISRNGRQDQGTALDILCPNFADLSDFLDSLPAAQSARLLALDGVTNPQNVGMIIRSARAAGMTGILYADQGNPALGPLVIKASAGTVYGAPLLRCDQVTRAVAACQDAGFTLYSLQAEAAQSLFDTAFAARSLFILGGETAGISVATAALAPQPIAIPMAQGVESLNVAVSAALVCYASAPGRI